MWYLHQSSETSPVRCSFTVYQSFQTADRLCNFTPGFCTTHNSFFQVGSTRIYHVSLLWEQRVVFECNLHSDVFCLHTTISHSEAGNKIKPITLFNNQCQEHSASTHTLDAPELSNPRLPFSGGLVWLECVLDSAWVQKQLPYSTKWTKHWPESGGNKASELL